MDNRFYTVTVKHLLHGGRRHEIGVTVVSFEKSETFVGGFDHPFSTGGGLTNLLLELGKHGVILKHELNQLARVRVPLYGFPLATPIAAMRSRP